LEPLCWKYQKTLLSIEEEEEEEEEEFLYIFLTPIINIFNSSIKNQVVREK
tara:strand:+ start:836 stop:988 length:153 start_codon:yes stop_codon:yes gene_type:complete